MYCRHCHYDLRGKLNLRCPECGSRFDAQDVGTYLLRVPTGLQTILRVKAVKTIAKLLAIAILYSMLVALFAPAIFSSRCGALSGPQMSHSMLHSIVRAHLLNAESSSEDGTLTVEEIRPDLAPSWYSRSVQPQRALANQWSRRATDILKWSVLALGPAFIMIVLTRRWARKFLIVIASMCAVLVLFSLISMYVVAGFRRTSSYAFVRDYVLVSNFDWRRWASSPLDGIVAFEKKPWPGSRRVVARNPWTIRILREVKFQELLSQQPVARRAWDDCIAASECAKVSE